jgi:hypothetical protein
VREEFSLFGRRSSWLVDSHDFSASSIYDRYPIISVVAMTLDAGRGREQIRIEFNGIGIEYAA